MRRLLASALLLWTLVGCGVDAPPPNVDEDMIRQQQEAREKTRAEESKRK